MRVVQLADDAEVFFSVSGADAAVAMLRSRRGTEFDPRLVDLCCDHTDEIFAGLDAVDAWTTVLDDCPALDRRIRDDELDAALDIFADYADLKSPWYLGHSRAAAELAASAARFADLAPDAVGLVRAPGWFTDSGRPASRPRSGTRRRR